MRDLAAADGVDHDPRRVGRVPHLELELDIDGLIAEAPALHADVGPLAVGEPGDVVARPDMDRVVGHLVGELGAHRVGLGDLLGHEALALQHVVEVGVAADVQLAGPLEAHAAVHEELGEDPVDDGGAHLGLDVVADHGQAALLEPAPPVALARDEHGDAVDEAAARVEDLLHVPLGRHLAPDGEEIHHHVGARLAEDARDVGGGTGGLRDHLREVLAQAVMRHAPMDGDAEVRDLGEAHRVVRLAQDGFGQVEADLAGIDVEGGGELDVAHVIAVDPRPHEAGDEPVIGRVAVVLDALDQCGCAVADPDDRDSNRSHSAPPVLVSRVAPRRRTNIVPGGDATPKV